MIPGGEPGFWPAKPESDIALLQEPEGLPGRVDLTLPPEPTVTPGQREVATAVFEPPPMLETGRQGERFARAQVRARQLAQRFAHLPKEQRDAEILRILNAEGFRVVP